MKRYLLLMYNEEMPMPSNPTKEQMEAGIKPWRDYLTPLMNESRVESVSPVQRDGKMVTPTGLQDYKAEKVDLGGYMVVKANSMEEAIEIAKKSPHAMSKSGPTTIREVVDVPM